MIVRSINIPPLAGRTDLTRVIHRAERRHRVQLLQRAHLDFCACRARLRALRPAPARRSSSSRTARCIAAPRGESPVRRKCEARPSGVLMTKAISPCLM